MWCNNQYSFTWEKRKETTHPTIKDEKGKTDTNSIHFFFVYREYYTCKRWQEIKPNK